uniref:Uncharacterized protein n=1 Tax=Arundo donax TaxID=35708 RepID=A0A0A9H0Q3_ARUDO
MSQPKIALKACAACTAPSGATSSSLHRHPLTSAVPAPTTPPALSSPLLSSQLSVCWPSPFSLSAITPSSPGTVAPSALSGGESLARTQVAMPTVAVAVVAAATDSPGIKNLGVSRRLEGWMRP